MFTARDKKVLTLSRMDENHDVIVISAFLNEVSLKSNKKLALYSFLEEDFFLRIMYEAISWMITFKNSLFHDDRMKIIFHSSYGYLPS